jgi:hypothetical protein
MLTPVDAISLAGDRLKQNDDAVGAHRGLAWVIDGATDLHDAPVSGEASDAAWLARELDRVLTGAEARDEMALRTLVRSASRRAAAQFLAWAPEAAAWQRPIASSLMIADAGADLVGLDLGDCRAFSLDAEGASQAIGGPKGAADREEAFAAKLMQSADPRADGAQWRAPNVLAALRDIRTQQNKRTREAAIFSLDEACADAARTWRLPFRRPGHILLCTDGFSALVDRYEAYTPAAFVQAALERGLAELMTHLRAIEQDDAGGARHPRFKRSDDATALLVRIT